MKLKLLCLHLQRINFCSALDSTWPPRLVDSKLHKMTRPQLIFKYSDYTVAKSHSQHTLCAHTLTMFIYNQNNKSSIISQQKTTLV